MMNKEQKRQYISDMTNQFEKSEAVIVTHYQGLTMNQLDEFQRLSFLSLGATVIIDWGWVRGDKSIQSILEPPSIVVKDGDKVSLDFDLFKEETVDGKTQASEWVKHSKKKYGDWDGLIGVVTKVDWNVNEEGAFECSATVQGKGSHAFEDPIAIKERHNRFIH